MFIGSIKFGSLSFNVIDFFLLNPLKGSNDNSSKEKNVLNEKLSTNLGNKSIHIEYLEIENIVKVFVQLSLLCMVYVI